ncbi:hypothetical protein HDU84_008737 [Entophlyctis sp. JEL0112]|nr:hypothetical protein HDU84_008737 [Entophlyctis sp. JEL0112]
MIDLTRADSGACIIHSFAKARKYWKIPAELQLCIFRKLCPRDQAECSRVCRDWKDSAQYGLWYSPSLTSPYALDRFIRAISSSKILRRFEANYKIFDFINPLHIAYIAEAAPALVHLNLSNCKNITDSAIAQLLCVCSHSLKHLDVSYCGLISDPGVQLFASFFAQHCILKTLRLRGCSRVGDPALVALGGVESLESLDISGAKCVTDRGIFRFLDQRIAGSQEVPHKRNSVEYSSKMDSEHVGEFLVGKAKVAEKLGRLREFRFSGEKLMSRKIGRSELERILECLTIGHNIQCLEFSIPLGPKGASNLMPYNTFPVEFIPSTVTSLHLHNIESLPSCKLLEIIQAVGGNLNQLTLSPMCQYSINTLQCLIAHTPKLTSLAILESMAKNELLDILVNSECAQNLKYLDLSKSRISDSGVVQILCKNSSRLQAGYQKGLPQLQRLILRNCLGISIESVLALCETYGHISKSTDHSNCAEQGLVHLDVSGTAIRTHEWMEFCDSIITSSSEKGGMYEHALSLAGVDFTSMERDYVLTSETGGGSAGVWRPLSAGHNGAGPDAAGRRVFQLRSAAYAFVLRSEMVGQIAATAASGSLRL